MRAWRTGIRQTDPVRRLVVALTAAVVAFVPAWPSHAATRSGTDVCVIDDPRATELSGLVATPSGYIAVTDSKPNPDDMAIIYLDATCKVTRTLAYPTPARDPEDLAVAPDGALWVADIGDNVTSPTRRETVALWLVPSHEGAPVIHRLTYPDGPHDAEALLFSGDGTPIIVTKEPNGVAGLYRPEGPLRAQSEEGVPLVKVGEFQPVASGASNSLGELGEVLITGAATAPDRTRIALRTYTTAYEWDLQGGDVVKAITTGNPRVTPLPDEPFGEAIAYTADGTAFLTVSDEEGPTTLRRYERGTTLLREPVTTAVAAPTGLTGVPLWLAVSLSVVGVIVAIAGYLGMRRSRTHAETPSV